MHQWCSTLCAQTGFGVDHAFASMVAHRLGHLSHHGHTSVCHTYTCPDSVQRNLTHAVLTAETIHGALNIVTQTIAVLQGSLPHLAREGHPADNELPWHSTLLLALLSPTVTAPRQAQLSPQGPGMLPKKLPTLPAYPLPPLHCLRPAQSCPMPCVIWQWSSIVTKRVLDHIVE